MIKKRLTRNIAKIRHEVIITAMAHIYTAHISVGVG